MYCNVFCRECVLSLRFSLASLWCELLLSLGFGDENWMTEPVRMKSVDMLNDTFVLMLSFFCFKRCINNITSSTIISEKST